MSELPHETIEERLLHRLLFFSDAVFAIVMTLLVLELRPPEGREVDAARAIGEMTGHLVAFGISFALISVFWLVHMNITRRLIHFDWPTAIANLAFLFPVCLLPFASAWLGSAFAAASSWSVYCVVLIATSLVSTLLVLTATRDGGRLMAGGVTRAERGYRLFRSLIPGIAFTVGFIAVSLKVYLVAWNCWILIPLLFAVANRFFKPAEIPYEVRRRRA